ncbi:GRB10-interacting GYF protein 2-like isoform X2 [Ylistrum balloti]|uniref:GRB10-interacting GYF protein 2-like isoform X2 n=1 Tax=Ylistrum balloti TaxID=509963 RepID=UPI002905D43C|nr:GRB10-interacting GYF protein 2-like isoform X2 [Ylistrum balloti]
MADTLKFGPEWLRALSDGNSLGTPPPSPGFGKYKLADYRYGREEMLALYNPNSKVPEELEGQTYVMVEKSQEPLALIPLSEEEQRLLSQSVNSMAVLRMFGRGGPPGVRGGRGMGPERGRGRGLGRGRGEGGFLQRGTSYEETGGGGYGRPSRTDGWEEVGSKRNYQNRYDESGLPRREFTRSVSNTDNWRGRDEEEEGDGDWRKTGSSKWGARGNWRDPSNRERGGFDSRPNGVQRGGRTYQRSRNSESWDDEGENLPEWSMPDSDDVEEPGTFDSSGAFVFNKLQLKGMARGGGKGDPDDNQDRKAAPGLKLRDSPTNSQHKHDSKEDKNDTESGYNNGKDDEETDTSVKEDKDRSPQIDKDNKDRNVQGKSSQQLSSQEVERPNSKVLDDKRPSNLSTGSTSDTKQTSVQSKTAEIVSSETQSSAQKQKSAPSAAESKTKSTKKSSSKKESQMEQEALDRLKEKAENMVLEAIDVEAEEEEEESSQEDENTKKWFYLDPQGDVQGPFASSEMAEWFSAGYFTMNLKVKRGCDDRYSPLGELIKRWGRVPFLPGSAPPPLLNSPQRPASPDLASQQQQDHIKRLQHQYALQQHMMHQQMVLRHFQMQQVMTQLQENEDFKNLPPLHQQQLATQILLKQSAMLPVPAVQSDPKLSPRSPPTERVGGESPRPMSHTFHRSMSQPADLTKSPPQTDDGSIWGSVNPAVQDLLSQGTGSVWDLDPKSVISAADLEAQLEKARKETDERQKEEEEKLRSELFHRKQEELRLQKEEIQREKERMELERQKYMELKLEEMRQKEEAEKQMREEKEMQRRKAEEERRQMEDKIRRQKEEELRRRREEEMRLQELQRQQADLRQQEIQRQELIRQQEIQRQQEIKRQEEEEMEKQKQLEIQKRQEAQRQQELQHKQQEALRKLQQEQMAKMQDQLAKIQLPSHAQWANQQTNAMGASGVSSKTQSLLEIQEQEERERYEQESMQMQQRKAEAQRQQMMNLQQQQQKSWSSQVIPIQGNGKTLLEIQEEQSQQETERKSERQQTQQNQTKNLTLGAASVWGGVTSPSHWASEGAWGNAVRAQTSSQQNSGTSNGAGSLGFWDDAIISSKRAPAASSRNSGGQTNNAEFPALKGGQPNVSAPIANTTSKPKPSKLKKEEEAVQKLFQGSISKGDDFTQWCERELRNMATSVDIPTFISFLKEVDSPYEVHDYVRSYLGENKASIDFAKQFLERRSQNRNKSRQQQHQPEDSIWGPAPARDFRQSQPSNQVNEFETQKAKGKKKKKMTKIDSSILGFTVHADPARKNIGEIDNINK